MKTALVILGIMAIEALIAFAQIKIKLSKEKNNEKAQKKIEE